MKIFCTILALTLAAHAEEKKEEVRELPIEVAPFRVSTELEGTLIPSKTQTLSLDPERWSQFVVESVAEHGTMIAEGEPLIVFETEEMQKALVQLEADLAAKELRHQIAQRELAELQQKNELALAASKRGLENAENDLEYLRETGLPARKEDLQHRVTKAKDYLAYAKEELDQLKKMYEEDDLTEETEEIILQRQEADVRDAELRLEGAKRETARALDTTLPRSLASQEDETERARIAYATAKLNLERNYELKKLDVAKLERDVEEATEALDETKADQDLFEIPAEFDGRLVYGEFTEGIWNRGKTGEFLKKGGTVPTLQTVLTLVAQDSPLALHATLKPEKVTELKEFAANQDDESPEITIADFPNLAGEYLVTLPAQSSEDLQAPGQTDTQEVVFYENEEAIALPKKAVQTNEDGTSQVLVKLSEGEPEERVVELGQSTDETVEILSGLEEGQVVLIP